MRRRAARLALATAALGSVLLPAIASPSYAGTPEAAAQRTSATARGGAAGRVAATTPDLLAVGISLVSPTVALNGAKVTVVATVRNLGDTPVSGISVTVRDGSTSITTRAQVAAWAASRTEAGGAVLASAPVRGTLAAGAGTSVSLTVSSLAAGRSARWGAVPVDVEAAAGSVAGRVHTFLGYQVEKQYVPVATAVLLPLVLDPDPDLSGTGSTRATAWADTTGQTSRLERILTGASATAASLVLDPALTLTPRVPTGAASDTSPAPTATSSGSTSAASDAPAAPGPTDPASVWAYAASSSEQQARADLATRIRPDPANAHPGSPFATDRLLLPMGDPDVAAPTIGAAVDAAVQATADAGGPSASPTIAWPADGAWSGAIESTIRAAYGPHLNLALVSSASLRGGDQTAEANERSSTGLRLAVYDAPLSGLLGRATTGAGPLALQQFVADSAALVAERAGTERQVLLVGPRGMNPSPSDLNGLLTGIGSSVPWVAAVGARSVVDASSAAAEVPLAHLAPRPTQTPATLLTPAATTALARAAGTVTAMAAVRSDGTSFATPLLQTRLQLLATSWRSTPGPWRTLDAALSRAATAGATGVYVSPRQINFLADSGRIQITVVNNLDVAIHDLTLTLTPDNPRLRIDGPAATVSVGARSRTTQTFRVTALAAGSVPITATLTAPDGTVIRTDAPVRISVTPTGDWMYWVLGSIAGTILVVGIWRGVRHGHPTHAVSEAAAAAAAQDAT